MRETPPLLLALPHGLNVSGVTMWAVRLANALAAGSVNRNDSETSPSGAGLIVHGEPVGQSRLPLPLHPDVEIYDARDLPPIENAGGDLEPFVKVYRHAAKQMASRFGGPVVLSPNLQGDFYGIAARLTQLQDIRVVAWQHSDIEYNTRLFARYEEVISRFVAVSHHIRATLQRRIELRSGDVVRIPFGVPIATTLAARTPNLEPCIRLIYTGRMDQKEKRVGVLIDMSDELNRRGVDHKLTLVGDGPAEGEIDALVETRADRIQRLPPTTPDNIETLLDQSDIFVLSSRYEGLSVSMLEAMARGCVPVVTRVDSGATDVIEQGVNGVMTEAGSNEDTVVVARSLADAVLAAIAGGIPEMSQRAWRTVASGYSVEEHADSARKLLQEIARTPRRSWPSEKPWAFTCQQAEPGIGSGSVPPDGAQRMKNVLEILADRSVVIYGAGEHTRQLAHIIEAAPIKLVAIADDDPSKRGSAMLGVPIIAPKDFAMTHADDIVISSWMNEEPMFKTASLCKNDETNVHRLYD